MREGKRSNFFHTTSHIMAQAIKRLYPETKLAIGPSIENGFIMIWIVRRHLWQKILQKNRERDEEDC